MFYSVKNICQSTQNMENLCRLCGQLKRNWISILESNNESQKIRLQIYDVLGIKVHRCDTLPTHVCSCCVTALQEAAAFINCCHCIQKMLEEKCGLNCQATLFISHSPDSQEKTKAFFNGNNSSFTDAISTEKEEHRVNVDYEKHSDIFENANSIFVSVSEQEKMSSWDSNELVPEIVQDSLVSDHCISGTINEVVMHTAVDEEVVHRGVVTSIEKRTITHCPRITEGNVSNLNFDLQNRISAHSDRKQSVTSASDEHRLLDSSDSSRSSLTLPIDLAADDQRKNNACPTSNVPKTVFKCKTCGKKFLQKSTFHDHLNEHTGYRPFKCELCDKTFRRRSDVRVHTHNVHSKGEFKCTLCGFVANHKGRLRIHLKSSHEKPCLCNMCGYRCGVKSRMEDHIINKHALLFNPPNVCEICGTSFKSQMNLRTHQQNIHFPEPQICKLCGEVSPNISKYRSHVARCGKEKERYTCDMCGRTYANKAILKEHMNTHLNIKPYKCEICDKRFYLRVRLLTHKAVHGAPTFQCDVCFKSFNRKDNMKSHMKKHCEK